MKARARYSLNKNANIGDECICPSCNNKFIKTNKQQAFCRTQGGSVCKDKYWNTVTPNKRNNTTRISPASARYMERNFFDVTYDDHPFSSEALGQD